jgi:hypothetical protein
MGEHRMLCGDATLAEDLRRVLADGLVPISSSPTPPYNVAFEARPQSGSPSATTLSGPPNAGDYLSGRYRP